MKILTIFTLLDPKTTPRPPWGGVPGPLEGGLEGFVEEISGELAPTRFLNKHTSGFVTHKGGPLYVTTGALLAPL